MSDVAHCGGNDQSQPNKAASTARPWSVILKRLAAVGSRSTRSRTNKCCAVAWVTPALTQSVSDARQNSSTRSGTVSAAATSCGVGGLAIVLRRSLVQAHSNSRERSVCSGAGRCRQMRSLPYTRPITCQPLATACSTSPSGTVTKPMPTDRANGVHRARSWAATLHARAGGDLTRTRLRHLAY